MDSNQISLVLSEIYSIDAAVGNSSIDESYLVARARSLILTLDQNSFFRRSVQEENQIYAIRVFQRLAFYDVDSGGIADIADWCIARWLRILRRNPHNVDILQGMKYHSPSIRHHVNTEAKA
jgi:hypothetical protein